MVLLGTHDTVDHGHLQYLYSCLYTNEVSLWGIYQVYKPTRYGYMHQEYQEYTLCIEYSSRVQIEYMV